MCYANAAVQQQFSPRVVLAAAPPLLPAQLAQQTCSTGDACNSSDTRNNADSQGNNKCDIRHVQARLAGCMVGGWKEGGQCASCTVQQAGTQWLVHCMSQHRVGVFT
jgi:hypothetical protein